VRQTADPDEVKATLAFIQYALELGQQYEIGRQ
jgi:hypothetical protein